MKSFLVLVAGLLSSLLLGVGQAKASTYVCEDGDYHMSVNTTAAGAWISFEICEFAECASTSLRETGNFKSGIGLNYDYSVSNGIYANEIFRVQYASPFAPNTIERFHDGFAIQTFSNCRQI